MRDLEPAARRLLLGVFGAEIRVQTGSLEATGVTRRRVDVIQNPYGGHVNA